MVELHRWLSHQHLGIGNLHWPWVKTNELARDATHRAVNRRLASIIDPFTESFDEKNASRARRTLERRLDIMREAEDAISLASERQIDTLNKLAGPRNASDRLPRHGLRPFVGGTHLRPFPSAENHIPLSQI